MRVSPWIAMGAALLLGGCHTDMWVQPRVETFQEADFYADKSAARKPVAGTVARGNARTDDLLYTGRTPDKKLATSLPKNLTLFGNAYDTKVDLGKVVQIGQERYTAFCSPCHGAKGDGQGMITQRGLILRRPPANYHTDRLRNMPIGHFYDVQTNGAGIMYSAATRVSPDERWAISAYIRALQLSQFADPAKLSDEDRAQLAESGGAK